MIPKAKWHFRSNNCTSKIGHAPGSFLGQNNILLNAAGLVKGTNGQMQLLRLFSEAKGNHIHISSISWYMIFFFPQIRDSFLLNVEILCLKVNEGISVGLMSDPLMTLTTVLLWLFEDLGESFEEVAESGYSHNFLMCNFVNSSVWHFLFAPNSCVIQQEDGHYKDNHLLSAIFS